MITSSPIVGRQSTARKFLHNFYPNHYVIWIDSHDDYKNIDQRLQEKTKNDVIILQTEEDVFRFLDIQKLREKIVNNKNWTNNSFLITNSKKDHETSKHIIKTIWRPGILDLICYKIYRHQDYPIEINNINFHTGFLYQAQTPLRQTLWKVCEKFDKKNSILAYNRQLVNNLNDETPIFNGSSSFTAFNAPYVDIQYDYSWAVKSAFLISLETYNHGTLPVNNNYDNYAPTLSEKTFRTMHLGRPSLIFGGPGTRDYLKHFGFDTWDWFIDWSFDREKDYKKSLKLYVKELNRLYNTPIEELKNILTANEQALKYNRYHIFNLIKNYGNIK